MCNTKEEVVEFTCIPSKAPCYHRLSFICPKLLNWIVLSCTLKYFTHISFTYPSLICPLRKTTWNRIPQYVFDMPLRHYCLAFPFLHSNPTKRTWHGEEWAREGRCFAAGSCLCSPIRLCTNTSTSTEYSAMPLLRVRPVVSILIRFIRSSDFIAFGCCFAFSSDTDRNNSGKIELHVLVNNCCTTQRENRFVSFIEIYLWFGLSPDSIRRQQQEEASSNKVSEFMCKDYSQSEPFAG